MEPDRIFKEDIRVIVDIDTLLKLEPRQYFMKGGTKLQYGFIEQDLELTPYKNLVYSNHGGIKSIAYTQLIAVLTSHIQELTKRVVHLESKQNQRNL